MFTKQSAIKNQRQKAVIYDLHENYEVHLLASDIDSETDALNIIYYLTEEGFLPDEKGVGIKLIPHK